MWVYRSHWLNRIIVATVGEMQGVRTLHTLLAEAVSTLRELWACWPCSPQHGSPCKWEFTLWAYSRTARDHRPVAALPSTWRVPQSKLGNWQTPEKHLSVARFIITSPSERHFRSIVGILAKLSLLAWCSALLPIPGNVLNHKQT